MNPDVIRESTTAWIAGVDHPVGPIVAAYERMDGKASPRPLDRPIVEKRGYKRGLWQKNVFTYERADDGSTHPGGTIAESALDTPSRRRV